MTRVRLTALFAVLIAPIASACSDPTTAVSYPTRPSLALVTTEIERVITAEEFALADVDGTAGICVKGTSSSDVLMKDANAATPSQPCPPAWQYVGKPAAIKIVQEWFTEDKNANGLVCVKFVADAKTIVKDDNAGTPSQPCPPAFSPVGKTPTGPRVDADDLQAADDDGDGLACLHALPSGNFIIRDDNDETPSQPCPAGWFLHGSKKTEPAPAEPPK